MIYSETKTYPIVGKIRVDADEEALVSVAFASSFTKDNPSHLTNKAHQELSEYFEKKRKCFDLPLKYISGTPFQRSVWSTLNRINYGETITYKGLASLIKTNAVRALSSAVGKNPFVIILPCHRVVGKNNIGGYSGAPLSVKISLLELENSDSIKK